MAAVTLSDLAYQATWLSRPADSVRILELARSRSPNSIPPPACRPG